MIPWLAGFDGARQLERGGLPLSARGGSMRLPAAVRQTASVADPARCWQSAAQFRPGRSPSPRWTACHWRLHNGGSNLRLSNTRAGSLPLELESGRRPVNGSAHSGIVGPDSLTLSVYPGARCLPAPGTIRLIKPLGGGGRVFYRHRVCRGAAGCRYRLFSQLLRPLIEGVMPHSWLPARGAVFVQGQ